MTFQYIHISTLFIDYTARKENCDHLVWLPIQCPALIPFKMRSFVLEEFPNLILELTVFTDSKQCI